MNLLRMIVQRTGGDASHIRAPARPNLSSCRPTMFWSNSRRGAPSRETTAPKFSVQGGGQFKRTRVPWFRDLHLRARETTPFPSGRVGGIRAFYSTAWSEADRKGQAPLPIEHHVEVAEVTARIDGQTIISLLGLGFARLRTMYNNDPYTVTHKGTARLTFWGVLKLCLLH